MNRAIKLFQVQILLAWNCGIYLFYKLNFLEYGSELRVAGKHCLKWLKFLVASYSSILTNRCGILLQHISRFALLLTRKRVIIKIVLNVLKFEMAKDMMIPAYMVRNSSWRMIKNRSNAANFMHFEQPLGHSVYLEPQTAITHSIDLLINRK